MNKTKLALWGVFASIIALIVIVLFSKPTTNYWLIILFLLLYILSACMIYFVFRRNEKFQEIAWGIMCLVLVVFAFLNKEGVDWSVWFFAATVMVIAIICYKFLLQDMIDRKIKYDDAKVERERLRKLREQNKLQEKQQKLSREQENQILAKAANGIRLTDEEMLSVDYGRLIEVLQFRIKILAKEAETRAERAKALAEMVEKLVNEAEDDYYKN